ncbi:uncharacterized protein V6R79_014905 [Siganus canaliculatus]
MSFAERQVTVLRVWEEDMDEVAKQRCWTQRLSFFSLFCQLNVQLWLKYSTSSECDVQLLRRSKTFTSALRTGAM